MGKTHALSGVTIALGYTALSLPGAPTSWPGVVVFAVVTAGGALLPDLDHPSSSIARSWGPVTRAVARFTERVSGGHRHGTHTLAFAIAVGALMTAAGMAGGVWTLVPVFLATSLAVGVLWDGRGLRNEAVAAGLTLLVHLGTGGEARWLDVWAPWFLADALRAVAIDPTWLGIALGLGCLAHCLGDLLTPEAFRFLWPWPKRIALGLFTTDTWYERVLAHGLRVANVALLVLVSGYWPEASGAARDSLPYITEIATRMTGVGA